MSAETPGGHHPLQKVSQGLSIVCTNRWWKSRRDRVRLFLAVPGKVTWADGHKLNTRSLCSNTIPGLRQPQTWIQMGRTHWESPSLGLLWMKSWTRANCAQSAESWCHYGLHPTECGQQAKWSDSALPLCAVDTRSTVSSSGAPNTRKTWTCHSTSRGGHKDALCRGWSNSPRRQTERVVIVQPREDKTPDRPYWGLLVPKGAYKKKGTTTLYKDMQRWKKGEWL